MVRRFETPIELPGAPTQGSHAVNKTYVDTHINNTSNPHSVTASQVGAPPTSRTLTAGDGLSGGGTLAADRTFDVDATVVRTSGNQTIAGIKNFSGSVGVGTTSPDAELEVIGELRATSLYIDSGKMTWTPIDSALDVSGVVRLKNNKWLQGRDASDSQYLDMFRINTVDQIEVGQDLLLGNITFETNGGDVQFTNMDITSAPASGAQMSYSMDLDNQKSFEVYSEADGLGGLQNRQNRNFVPVSHVAFDGTVDTPASDQMKMYVKATGTSPNREVAMMMKDETGQEIIMSSVIV